MALRKNPPDMQKSSDRTFSTKAAAESWIKEEKKKSKQMGVTIRYDIVLSANNQWRVEIDYYLDK